MKSILKLVLFLSIFIPSISYAQVQSVPWLGKLTSAPTCNSGREGYVYTNTTSHSDFLCVNSSWVVVLAAPSMLPTGEVAFADSNGRLVGTSNFTMVSNVLTTPGNLVCGGDYLPATAASLSANIDNLVVDSRTQQDGASVTVTPADDKPIFFYGFQHTIFARKCTATDCSSFGSPVTLATDFDTNFRFTASVDKTGMPFLIYSRQNQGPQIVYCTNVNCTSTHTNLLSADGASPAEISVAVNASNNLEIFYRSVTGQNDYYIECADPTTATPCNSGFTPVLIGAGCTTDSTIVNGADNLPIMFADCFATSKRAYHCADIACTSPTNNVITWTSGNHKLSGVLGPDGFAKFTSGGNSVFMNSCGDTTCTAPSSSLILSAANLWAAMSVRPEVNGGNPIVTIINNNTGTSYLFICADASCTSSGSNTLGFLSSTTDPAIAGAPDGNAVIGPYWFSSSDNLNAYYAHLATLSAVGTNLGSNSVRIANVYVKGHTVSGGVTIDGTAGGLGTLNLGVLTADPALASTPDGAYWYNSTTKTDRCKTNGIIGSCGGTFQATGIATTDDIVQLACSPGGGGSFTGTYTARDLTANKQWYAPNQIGTLQIGSTFIAQGTGALSNNLNLGGSNDSTYVRTLRSVSYLVGSAGTCTGGCTNILKFNAGGATCTGSCTSTGVTSAGSCSGTFTGSTLYKIDASSDCTTYPTVTGNIQWEVSTE